MNKSNVATTAQAMSKANNRLLYHKIEDDLEKTAIRKIAAKNPSKSTPPILQSNPVSDIPNDINKNRSKTLKILGQENERQKG